MRRVKILHIITRLDRWGSAQDTILTVRRLCQLSTKAQRSGVSAKKYQVVLVTGSVRDVDISDINIVVIPKLRREINSIVRYYLSS